MLDSENKENNTQVDNEKEVLLSENENNLETNENKQENGKKEQPEYNEQKNEEEKELIYSDDSDDESTKFSDEGENEKIETETADDSDLTSSGDNGELDGNNHTYNDYKNYFTVAGLDPENNFPSKTCKNAYKAYLKVEREKSAIREKYKRQLDKNEKDFKKIEKKLRHEYKNRGPEFFQTPNGGFFQLEAVRCHLTGIESYKSQMKEELRKEERKFLDEMNKNIIKDGEDKGQIMDVMKINDSKLFFKAQDDKKPNPEQYTISGRKKNLYENSNFKQLLTQFVNEKSQDRKNSLWNKIKEAVKVYLFGEKNKTKHDSIVEKVLNKIKTWLGGDDKKNKNGQELYNGMMAELLRDISDKKTNQLFEKHFLMYATRTPGSGRLWYNRRDEEQSNEDFSKLEDKYGYIDRINAEKLLEHKKETMNKNCETEKDKILKQEVNKLKTGKKEVNVEKNSKVNNQTNNKKTSNINVETTKKQENNNIKKGNKEKEIQIDIQKNDNNTYEKTNQYNEKEEKNNEIVNEEDRNEGMDESYVEKKVEKKEENKMQITVFGPKNIASSVIPPKNLQNNGKEHGIS